MDLCIVIPTYNRAEQLRLALASLQRLSVPTGWEVAIIVVDNNSADHTPAVVEELGQKGVIAARRVLERKQGLNHSRNRGLVEAGAEWVVYLDDDMLVGRNWLHGLSEAIAEYEPDAVVGPVEPWFQEQPLAWLSSSAVASVTSPYSRKGDHLKVLDTDCAHELPGCNFAVRRSAAIEIGGFHPDLDRLGIGMLAGGDFELGLRFVRLGKRVVYSPKCRIEHFISREKVSPAGLRARWEGMGATGRALEMLDGKPLSVWRLLRYTVGMLRGIAVSWWLYLLGQRSAAFDCELSARRAKGYLFRAPRLEPRRWPLEPPPGASRVKQ